MWVRIPKFTPVTYAERFSDCFITNIASEFSNYVLTMPFILLHLLGSVLIFFLIMSLFERSLHQLSSIHAVTFYAPFQTTYRNGPN